MVAATNEAEGLILFISDIFVKMSPLDASTSRKQDVTNLI